jgi:hypothetical protein
VSTGGSQIVGIAVAILVGIIRSVPIPILISGGLGLAITVLAGILSGVSVAVFISSVGITIDEFVGIIGGVSVAILIGSVASRVKTNLIRGLYRIMFLFLYYLSRLQRIFRDRSPTSRTFTPFRWFRSGVLITISVRAGIGGAIAKIDRIRGLVPVFCTIVDGRWLGITITVVNSVTNGAVLSERFVDHGAHFCLDLISRPATKLSN